MDMHPVVSDSLAAVGYDLASKTMRVAFLRGASYNYLEVPVEMHAALMAATSKGKHMHAYFRNNPAIKAVKHVEPTVDLH